MNQSELYGRVIKCNQAKPQKNANEGLGSKTAVWEQVCSYKVLEGLRLLTNSLQEGYASRYNVADGDEAVADGNDPGGQNDPMTGLEGLDEAGPRLR